MTWVKTDDQKPINRKVAALSDAAYRLDDEAMCWASRNLTDGCIGAEDLPNISRRAIPKYVDELVTRRRWHRATDPRCPSPYCPEPGPDGWVIHDYLDYNPTRQEVLRDRHQKAERQARWRATRRGSNASTEGSTRASPTPSRNAGGDAPVTPAPYPPRPAPKEGGGGAPAASAGRRGAAGPAAGAEREDQNPVAPADPNGGPPIRPPAERLADIRATIATARSRTRRPDGRPDAFEQLREATPDVAPLVEPDPDHGGAA